MSTWQCVLFICAARHNTHTCVQIVQQYTECFQGGYLLCIVYSSRAINSSLSLANWLFSYFLDLFIDWLNWMELNVFEWKWMELKDWGLHAWLIVELIDWLNLNDLIDIQYNWIQYNTIIGKTGVHPPCFKIKKIFFLIYPNEQLVLY